MKKLFIFLLLLAVLVQAPGRVGAQPSPWDGSTSGGGITLLEATNAAQTVVSNMTSGVLLVKSTTGAMSNYLFFANTDTGRAAAFTNALAAAEAGDLIQLGPFTMDFGTNQVNLKSNMTVRGSGWNTKLLYGGAQFMLPANNCVISDLKISPNTNGFYNPSVGFGSSAITSPGWTNVFIFNCHLVGVADTFYIGSSNLCSLTIESSTLDTMDDNFMVQSAAHVVNIYNSVLRATNYQGAPLAAIANKSGRFTVRNCYLTVNNTNATTNVGIDNRLAGSGSIDIDNSILEYAVGTSGTVKHVNSAATDSVTIGPNFRMLNNSPIVTTGSGSFIYGYTGEGIYVRSNAPAMYNPSWDGIASGNGAGVTNLPFTALSAAGQTAVSNAAFVTTDISASAVDFVRTLNTSVHASIDNDSEPGIRLYGGDWYGSGSGLTALNASQLTSGTIPIGRIQQTNISGAYWNTNAAAANSVSNSFSVTASNVFTSAMSASVAQQTASSLPGSNLTIAASSAVAGSSSAGAAAGGGISIVGGNAARLTSGNAAGGAVNITAGNSVGSTVAGNVNITAGSNSNSASGVVGGAVVIAGGVGNTGGGAVTITSGLASNGGVSEPVGSVTISTPNTVGNASSGGIYLIGGNVVGSSASGDGGLITLMTGNGATNGVASANGRHGGTLTLALGAGTKTTSATSVAGNGGNLLVNGGVGGDTTGTTTATAGTGSSIIIKSGAGGSATGGSGTRTGGDSGNITFQIGTNGTGATANGNIGSITLTNNGASVSLTTNKCTINTNVVVGGTVTATNGFAMPLVALNSLIVPLGKSSYTNTLVGFTLLGVTNLLAGTDYSGVVNIINTSATNITINTQPGWNPSDFITNHVVAPNGCLRLAVTVLYGVRTNTSVAQY